MTKGDKCFQPTWLCTALLDQPFWRVGLLSAGFDGDSVDVDLKVGFPTQKQVVWETDKC